MRTVSTIKNIGFALLLVFQYNIAKADDCAPIISDAMTWLKTTEPNYQHYVGFAISSLKAPAKFVSYGAGSFQFIGGLGHISRVSYLIGKNIATTFSDRTWCPEIAPGTICTGYQGFNYHAADTQQVYLYANGTAKIVLTTWGGASYNIPLTCTNGFLHGTLVEPNGNSMVVISLNKGKISIPH